MAVRTRSLVLLFLAVASGGLAAWLALGYLRRQAQPLLAATTTPGSGVVAARDLPVGTVVTERDLQMVEWPGNAIPPGMITTREAVIGRGLMTAMRQNEPFLESKLAPLGVGGGLRTIIAEGMRGLSIRVDEVIGVAGFVTPGTRVDVLLTMQGEGIGEPVTKAILQNIETLAAGQSIQVDAEGKAMPVPVVTMLVTPEQAETLAMAANQGRIQLTLRNVLDTLPIKTAGVRAGGLLSYRPPPSTASSANWRRAAAAARPPAVQETIIEGFRGGERTLTRFSRNRPTEQDPPPAPPPPEMP